MAPPQNQIIAGTSRGDTTIDVQKLLDRPWYRYKHLRNLYAWLSVVLLVQATNGLDGSIMNGMQTLTYWQSYFHHPTGAQLGIFNGTQGLGAVAAQFFLWWLVDKIGRKFTIIAGAVIIIVGVFLQSFARGIAMFAVARTIIGMGLSFEYTAAPMLVSELSHPTHRAQLSTLLNTLYYFGATLAAWITLGTLTIKSDWSWRAVSLIQMFPSLVSISLTWWVPESPRWLISKGRNEEAYKILVDHHCGGDENDRLASFEFHEIQQTLAFEKENGDGGWLNLFRTRGNRYRTYIVFSCSVASQASGQTIIGYYLVLILTGVGITNPQTQSIINGCLTMWNMGWAFWGASVIDKYGRRPMMLTSLSGMLIVGIVPWTICSALYTEHGAKGAGIAIIPFIFIFNAFYASTWNGILTGYTVECMSFDIRSKLICTQNFLVQATITGFNYLNPVALKNIGWKYYVVIDIIIVLEILMVYFTYPETSKITLEEVSIIFDGKKAVKNQLLEKQEIDVGEEHAQGKTEKNEKDLDLGISHREVIEK
ncbi:hexose transporter [Rhizodiscina lignyota]|uniref:Hexose transporter n=1 Tax=Rhizodiscina lignyota TaxID=1504668 RepID=A0A9P4IBF6_9PEZI|nr:hexose transporter [Rhizodiscina lignyota]